jgi:hypothetical protein
LKKNLSGVKKNFPYDWKGKVSRNAIVKEHASSLHRVVTVVYVLLVDEEDFQSAPFAALSRYC